MPIQSCIILIPACRIGQRWRPTRAPHEILRGAMPDGTALFYRSPENKSGKLMRCEAATTGGSHGASGRSELLALADDLPDLLFERGGGLEGVEIVALRRRRTAFQAAVRADIVVIIHPTLR